MIRDLYVWPSFLAALGERAEFARLDVGFEIGDVLEIRVERDDEPRTMIVTGVRPLGTDWVTLTTEVRR